MFEPGSHARARVTPNQQTELAAIAPVCDRVGPYRVVRPAPDAGHPDLVQVHRSGGQLLAGDFGLLELRRHEGAGSFALATAVMEAQHPALLRVRDLVTEGPRLAIVVELVSGLSLGGLRRRGFLRLGALGRAAIFALGARVADALHELQRAAETPRPHGWVGMESVLLTDAGDVRLVAGLPAPAANRAMLAWAGPTALEPHVQDDQLELGLLLLSLLSDLDLDGVSEEAARAELVRRALGGLPLGDPALPVLLRMLAPAPTDRYPSTFDAGQELSRLASATGVESLRREACSLFDQMTADEDEVVEADTTAPSSAGDAPAVQPASAPAPRMVSPRLDESALLDFVDTGRMERPAPAPLRPMARALEEMPEGAEETWQKELPLASLPSGVALQASDNLLDSSDVRSDRWSREIEAARAADAQETQPLPARPEELSMPGRRAPTSRPRVKAFVATPFDSSSITPRVSLPHETTDREGEPAVGALEQTADFTADAPLDLAAAAPSEAPELQEPDDEWAVGIDSLPVNLDAQRTKPFTPSASSGAIKNAVKAMGIEDRPSRRRESKTLPYSPAFVPKAATWNNLAVMKRPASPESLAPAPPPIPPAPAPAAAANTDSWGVHAPLAARATAPQFDAVPVAVAAEQTAPVRRKKRRGGAPAEGSAAPRRSGRVARRAAKRQRTTFTSLRNLPVRKSVLQNSAVLMFVTILLGVAVLTMGAHIATRYMQDRAAERALPPAQTQMLE